MSVRPVSEQVRQAHVVLDSVSREQKARKIISLLGEKRIRGARRILEIGCGSGIISSTLAALGGDAVEVYAVDVEDNRVDVQGYQFNQVENATLPFADRYFDIVISNYVIEHVGSHEEQAVHLREIRRVLSDSGTGYLGLPNRWRLMEPHFKLPLLSWLPQWLSDRYVRWSGRGTYYDCLPLSRRRARILLSNAQLNARDVTLPALRETLAIEHSSSAITAVVNRFVPDWLLALGMPVMPVYIFLLDKCETNKLRGTH
jgi:SAM-dependent methyltransferase